MSDTHSKQSKKNTEENKKSDVALREESMLAFWKERDIFHKSILTPAGKKPEGDFVFYDGPPFATGLPHYGHILPGTIKDAIPRFWTMNGKRAVRTWGWDCHGLPLENIIEKRLGLATKRDIEEMGVKAFNETAREAVTEYVDDWKRIIPRMGRFVDMDTDYKTMDPSYTESVWWAFSELNRRGLVYEGFKSMHLCPRCGTTLSNFEVNQGYKDVKDIAVTVKLPLLDDEGNETDTSLLVWTTTPWTLPGNMAAAVHKDLTYAKVRVLVDGSEEFVLLAKERLAQLGTEGYEVVEEMKGEALLGRRYQPPFDTFKKQDFEHKENAWKIYHAEYVEVGEEGTGAVHLAPAYGEEDMELAQKQGIPIMHHVDENGRFKDFVDHLSGQLVKPKDDETGEISHLDADIEIVKRLKDAGLLFRKETITHSYPHCWRCDTPLLNYATTSWFVRVTDLKDKLVKENKKIKWIPEHIGVSRFGKWLEGARDWAISRQRYWGAPLPIWRQEGTKEYKIFGSRAELLEHIPTSGNQYFLMRHGESELNTKEVLNCVPGVPNSLTEKGKAQIREAAAKLKHKKIDLIYYSPLSRTEETASIIGDALGLSGAQLIADERLLEMNFGEFEGKLVGEYQKFFGGGYNRLIKAPQNGETWNDVKRRVGHFLYDIDHQHRDKKILVVAHNGTLQMLQAAAYGTDHKTLGDIIDNDTFDLRNGEVRSLSFTPLPHNDNYEFDFHRPYIDEVAVVDEKGNSLTRVPDVFDCWFESGSMPYAQHHYPFEHKKDFLKNKYPAQFIAEGLDQTRGWFYSLLVLGTALFDKAPYEHVIVNGLVLAEDGKKMSKSLQNYPDPMELADRTGVDAMRYYLLSSPAVKAEDSSFSEKEVLEIQRKNIGRLHNVLAMYEMFADDNVVANEKSRHVLDRWMVARLNQTTKEITAGYINYELDKATRPLASLIDDLSVWYLRRSRERLKGADEEDKKACLATLRYTLKNLALLMAPAMPFYAEYLFQRVRDEKDAESVHLMPWPKEMKFKEDVLEAMLRTREIVRLGLEARARENIKVRQPLAALKVKELDLQEEFLSLIRDEVNVRSVTPLADDTQEAPVFLDTHITPELRREGMVRELMRAIQDERKKKGLHPEDQVTLVVDDKTKMLLAGFEHMVTQTVGATDIVVSKETDEVLELEGAALRFAIKR